MKPETLEVPDRVRRQIEELQREENPMPGEGEYPDRLTFKGNSEFDGEWVRASRLEAAERDRERAESALTEALELFKEINSRAHHGLEPEDSMGIAGASQRGKDICRSQIEGSNDG